MFGVAAITVRNCDDSQCRVAECRHYVHKETVSLEHACPYLCDEAGAVMPHADPHGEVGCMLRGGVRIGLGHMVR